jgi:hypothetical protein
MKLEDKQRLKRFWQAKVLLVTSAIGGMTFAIITRVLVILNLHHLISQKPAIRQYSQICPAGYPSSMCGAFEEFVVFSEEVRTEDLYQRFLLESLFLIGIFLGNIAPLLFGLRLHNPYPLSWSGHLLLSEEMIAELIALKHRRQKQNFPQWKLNLELTTEVLSLLWAIHIQVRLQNIHLNPGKKRNID